MIAGRQTAPGSDRPPCLDATLLGRGGAAFPTGRSSWPPWRRTRPFPRYMVCNADEMEPGTFKDRVLMHADPHLVIEGMILAGYAVQAAKGIIFIRPEYESAARILEREVALARQAGLSGREHPGQRFRLRYRRAPQRRALHLRRGHRPDQRHQGKRPNPQQPPPLSHRERALGPAHGRPKRGDPGLCAPYHAPRGRSGSRTWP